MSARLFPDSLLSALRDHDSIIISGHIRPDGDALGSTLALGACLKAAGKKVMMVNEHPVPGNLTFLPESNLVRQAADIVEVAPGTLFIAVDTATRQRLGDHVISLLEQCPLSVNIDHHGSNESYGDIPCVIPEQPATGAILYHLILEMGLPLPDAARDALYVAISTDTGSFQYKGTSAETMEIAADLIRRGVDVPYLNQKMYDEHPWRKTLLMKAVLEHLHRSDDGKVAYTCLRNEQKEHIGALPEDTEGLINILRSIEGVKVAAFFEEIENDTRIRISLRSKDPRLNVSEIAARFGGGGHPMAAGLRMTGPLREACHRVVEVLLAEAAPLD